MICVKITGLIAEHYALHTRIKLRPLAQIHAGSDRPVLFVGVHARLIVDYPLAEGKMALAELLEHAKQPSSVYRHAWGVGDLVMWDNRCTLHRGRRYDLTERRVMRRTTTDDLEPVRMVV